MRKKSPCIRTVNSYHCNDHKIYTLIKSMISKGFINYCI